MDIFSEEFSRPIPESTFRNFEGQYKPFLKAESASRSSTDSSSSEDSGLQSKKRGGKSLLGDKTDKALQDHLALVRRAGGVVSSSVVIAAAEVIVSRDYWMHLS